MPTFNHERYIAQAIESVLNQITNFDVHLYISDDASTDSTFKIASTFSNRNRVIINLTRKESNIGAVLNCSWLRKESINSDCKYVVILEGDDYWTDPYKLQMQVDFLETNSDFVICYHPVMILMPNGDMVDDFIAEKYFKAPESTIFDLAIYGNYIHTPSIMFRNANLSITDSFSFPPVADYFLYLLLAQKGKIKRLDFLGAVYRNGTGSFSGLSLDERKFQRQKTLNLASSDMNSFLVSFILKLRIHHNSLLGKMDHVILESSGVKDLLSFFKFVNKLELLKAIVKILFFKRVQF